MKGKKRSWHGEEAFCACEKTIRKESGGDWGRNSCLFTALLCISLNPETKKSFKLTLIRLTFAGEAFLGCLGEDTS